MADRVGLLVCWSVRVRRRRSDAKRDCVCLSTSDGVAESWEEKMVPCEETRVLDYAVQSMSRLQSMCNVTSPV